MEKVKDKRFQLADVSHLDSEAVVRPNINFWQDAWRRLRKNPVAMASLVTLVILIIFTIIGPHLRGLDYVTIDAKAKNIAPNAKHWFGTDSLGRDIFSRVWAGARVSILIALVATFIKVVLGSLYGAVMAYSGGYIDEIMMRY